MSQPEMLEEKMLMYSKKDRWNSSFESLVTQKVTKLTKSESSIRNSSNFGSDISFSELELKDESVDDPKLTTDWELVRNKSRFPRMIQTRSLLKDELQILKINMSLHEKIIALRESQMLKDSQIRKKRKKVKAMKIWGKKVVLFHKIAPSKGRDLLTEIEASESAKTDTVIWKFLKRESSLRKEFINARKVLLEVESFDLPDFRIQNSQPFRVTCPNCRFFITTKVKRVSVKAQFSSFVLALFGLCTNPHLFYVFKDTIHLCPLCKIYLGFCPAFGIRNRKALRSLEQTQALINKEIMEEQYEKMVSASSTSAKNLFVESKLRLSDRVQVNVNNIAAIARQIQRGSKANENLITAAKNFALQEAAMENSDTNLKKLKLLTTHINTQLDSLHNSSSNMELVLEQVRSMQR